MSIATPPAYVEDLRTCIQIIDVETTGIEDDARVCEIGAISLVERSNGLLQVKRAQAHLCDPGVPIPPTASAVHHITDNMVLGNNGLAATIKDHGYRWGDYHVAHNAEFDRRFLDAGSGLSDRVVLDNPWICTYKCAYIQWPDAPGYSNQALSYWLDADRPPKDCGHAHRALFDCYTTLGILKALVEAGWTWQRMVEVTSAPLILRDFGFGKHAGEPLEDVPTSYLQWMSRQGAEAWDADVWATLNHHLQRRAS